MKIYQTIFEYIQIYTKNYKLYKIYTKYQAAGPGASGPGRAAAAWPPPGILYIFCLSCIYLYIFVYILIYLVLHSFGGSNLNLRTSKQVRTFRPQWLLPNEDKTNDAVFCSLWSLCRASSFLVGSIMVPSEAGLCMW